VGAASSFSDLASMFLLQPILIEFFFGFTTMLLFFFGHFFLRTKLQKRKITVAAG